jgi:NAD(P)-dependent dehydrogenase (short-subunit alcohol dehydrogenase family)
MKTAMITGGTDGIGRALATALLEQGHTVLVVGRDETKAATSSTPRGRAADDPEHRRAGWDVSAFVEGRRIPANTDYFDRPRPPVSTS